MDLQTEPFDLAIRIGPPPVAPLTLVARPIAALPRYLYASPEYLNSAAPLTHPSDLARHVVCIVEGAMRSREVARTFYRGDESVDVMIGTRFAMNSVALNRGLAIQGVGLAVLDDVLARDDVTLGRLLRVLPDWSLAPHDANFPRPTVSVWEESKHGWVAFIHDLRHLTHGRPTSQGLCP